MTHERVRLASWSQRYRRILLPSGGATLWQSSAFALPVCCHALPVALPVF